MMKRSKRILMFTALTILVIALSCCERHSAAWPVMDLAENLMESRPDSSLAILDGIRADRLGGKEESARYALLKSMALDKNYIDTTTFDVLQPAIDYYLKNGTPDERLRTYYYQGRIYQNMNESEQAMNSLASAISLSSECRDSLTLVRALIVQAMFFLDYNDFDNYIDYSLIAADMSKSISHREYESRCLMDALNGMLVLNDKNRSDSIFNLLDRLELSDSIRNNLLMSYRLSYFIKFEGADELRRFVDNSVNTVEYDTDNSLKLALAYSELGENDRALRILDSIKSSGVDFNELRYFAVSMSVNKNSGNYKESLSSYEIYSRKKDSINHLRDSYKLRLVEDRHRIELDAQKKADEKSRIILWCVCGIIILALCIVILLLIVRSNKIQKELLARNVKEKEIENSNLKSKGEELLQEKLRLADDKANLESEIDRKQNEIDQKQSEIDRKQDLIDQKQDEIDRKQDLIDQKQDEINRKQDLIDQKQDEIDRKQDEIDQKQIEIDRKQDEIDKKQLEIDLKQDEIDLKQLEIDLMQSEIDQKQLEICQKRNEAEYLVSRIDNLEKEGEQLKALLDKKEEYSQEIKNAVNMRIDMLNSLLAGYISSNAEYEKSFDKWIKEETGNIKEFMNGTRLVFEGMHPDFIKFFEDMNLTTEEINYVCLYALGLKGKEVGKFMKRPSHINTSVLIRKKLGIDRQNNNLGVYVRDLLKKL